MSDVSSDRGTPKEPDSAVVHAPEGPEGLTPGPYLVKVDRYGSVSGLVKVKVPLGMLVIHRSNEAGSFDRSFIP